MRASRLSNEFDNEVIEFLQFNGKKHLPNNDGLFPCPCVSCVKRDPNITKEEVRGHLVWNKICQNYTQCIWHGEAILPSVSQRENVKCGYG